MSGAALDMTLDDLIKINKKPGGRGRGRGAGPGPSRRLPNRSANRSAPYVPPKAPESYWGHDMFFGGGGGGGGGAVKASSIETGTKLYVSNLDYGVSNEDVKELFAEVGDLKRYMIHYDKSGRSKGTAELVFSRRQDALDAIRKYNNVQLDGKPMKIELVGTNITTPGNSLPATGGFADSNLASQSWNMPFNTGQAKGSFGRSHGGRRGRGFGRGRGQGGGGRGEKVSAEDLDADLEKYHADSMQTN